MSEAAVMLFDGDCGFCRRWIKKWKAVTGDAVVYYPYQEVVSQYPQVSEKDCQKAVQLILSDGTVYSGAHAALKAYSLAGRYPNLLWMYEHIPPVGWAMEFVYYLIARFRSRLSKWI